MERRIYCNFFLFEEPTIHFKLLYKHIYTFNFLKYMKVEREAIWEEEEDQQEGWNDGSKTEGNEDMVKVHYIHIWKYHNGIKLK
jgi:hypothetical protein